jgi:hypothetical protein
MDENCLNQDRKIYYHLNLNHYKIGGGNSINFFKTFSTFRNALIVDDHIGLAC